MDSRRWVNMSQPQTLLYGTYLLYFSAVFTLLFFGEGALFALAFCSGGGCLSFIRLLRFVLPAAGVLGGYGIANEKKWGYYLAVGAATVPVLARILFSIRTGISPLSADIIGLAFDVALLALLLHPMSRNYQKIWFK